MIPLKYSQNFLKSPRLIETLVAKSSLGKKDTVYEIGPGKGIITSQLAKVCHKVIAIEKDRKLYESLRQKFSGINNVELVCGDFLKVKLPERESYKVFSNIPFSLTADILGKLTQAKNPPQDAYLIIQKEAAIKYAGLPYGKERLTSLILKPWFELKILHQFKPTDFSPVPGVDIVLFQIKKREKFLITSKAAQLYKNFVAYAFVCSSPSKTNLESIFNILFTHKQLQRLSRDLKFALSDKLADSTFNQWQGLFNYFLVGVSENKKRIIYGSAVRLESQQKKLIKIHRTRKY